MIYNKIPIFNQLHIVMKHVCFLLLALFSCFSYAQTIENAYRFEEQDSNESYQKYVGRTVRFRKSYGELEKELVIKAALETDYSIKSINAVEVKPVGIYKNFEITIVFQDQNGKELKMKACHSGQSKNKALIDQIPLYFVDEFEEFKKNNVGKILKKDPVIASYEITDVVFGNRKTVSGYLIAVTLLELKEKTTGKKIYWTATNSTDGLFEDALDQYVNYTISKVEQGDYSIEVEKGRSYNDSIINVSLMSSQGMIPNTPRWGFSSNGDDRIDFYITNNSNSTIKVLWNDAVFIGTNKSSSKVFIYEGLQEDDAVFINRNNTQEASTIIKGAKINGAIFPVKNVDYKSGKWTIKPILMTDKKTAPMIRVMLPIQYKDQVLEYIFELETWGRYKHPEKLNLQK